jgi:hypothetical protein
MRKIAAILVTDVGVREHRDGAVTLPREERERFSTPYFQAAATASRLVLIDLDQMPDRGFGRCLPRAFSAHVAS